MKVRYVSAGVLAWALMGSAALGQQAPASGGAGGRAEVLAAGGRAADASATSTGPFVWPLMPIGERGGAGGGVSVGGAGGQCGGGEGEVGERGGGEGEF